MSEIRIEMFILIILLLIAGVIGYNFGKKDCSETTNELQRLQVINYQLNQSYLSLNENYSRLLQNFKDLKKDCDTLKRDVPQLLREYIAKETLWEISGLEKYRRVIEILGIIVTKN